MRICWSLVIVVFAALSGLASSQQGAVGSVGAWTFDDGTANDLYGVNNGVIHGGVEFVEGKVGLAADLDGVFGYIEVPHTESMNALADAVTICAWVYVRDTGRSAGIWKGETVENSPDYLFRITYGSGNVPGRMGWGGNNGRDVEGQFFSLEEYDDRWMHVAQVMDGETIQAYVDFEPVEAVDAFGGHDGMEPKPLAGPYTVFEKEPFRLGMSQGVIRAGNKTYLNGMIDQVGLWSRALSQEEIVKAGQDLSLFLGVSSKGKLAISWAAVKAQRQ